ncbi:MAG: NTP transferase domain-containing protein [Gemmatimonadota bacterium]
MVLAAGLGKRLGALSDQIPKALLEVGGVTQLDRTLAVLEAAGASRIVVNVHHHADQIEATLEGRENIAEILVSREEPAPLETGGGLINARRLFDLRTPILVHNVDVISSVDLQALMSAHGTSRRAATLAVHERPASRYLLFDECGLQGRLDIRDGRKQDARPARGIARRFAFSGIHVASGRIFDLVEEAGAFSIIDLYLRLAGAGQSIQPFDVSAAEWFEIGTPERLDAARAALDPPES